MYRVIHPGPPTGEIGVIELDEEFAGQMLEHIIEIAAHLTPDIQACRQRRRRRSRDPETMQAAAVIQCQLQILKHQRRRLAQTIIPDHRRVADANAALLKYPAGKGRIALTFGRHASHGDFPVRATADMQHRPLEGKQRQHRPPAQHRLPGEYALDPTQGKGRHAPPILHHHIIEDQVRIQAAPAGIDAADTHRLADRFAGQPLDVRAVIGNLRQDDITQRQLHADEHQPDSKQQPAQCPQPGQNPAHGEQAPQAVQPVIGSATGLGDPGLLSQLSNHFARGGNCSLQSPD